MLLASLFIIVGEIQKQKCHCCVTDILFVTVGELRKLECHFCIIDVLVCNCW